MRHLPTNGGGPAITALLGNNAQMSTQSTSATLSHIKAGKLRALASFGAARSKALPDVPTMKELGYDMEYYLWVGMFAPKGTPAPVVAKLTRRSTRRRTRAQYRDRDRQSRPGAAYLNAAEFAKFWDADAKRADEAVHLIGRVQGMRRCLLSGGDRHA